MPQHIVQVAIATSITWYIHRLEEPSTRIHGTEEATCGGSMPGLTKRAEAADVDRSRRKTLILVVTGTGINVGGARGTAR